MTKENMADFTVVYWEFYYKAGSLDYERRVVCKIEKPTGQMIHICMFIVTNMEMSHEKVIQFYYNRGRIEYFIKEGKSGFDFAAVSSRSEIVSANRFQIHASAYNIFNYFRRFAPPDTMKRLLVDVIRLKLVKIAAKLVRPGRNFIF